MTVTTEVNQESEKGFIKYIEDPSLIYKWETTYFVDRDFILMSVSTKFKPRLMLRLLSWFTGGSCRKIA